MCIQYLCVCSVCVPVMMCLAARSTVRCSGCFMGSQAERRLMKALVGCSNKEQIIIRSHCPPPNSLQQHPPLQPVLAPLLKRLIGTIARRMRKGGVCGPVCPTLTNSQAAWKNNQSRKKSSKIKAVTKSSASKTEGK